MKAPPFLMILLLGSLLFVSALFGPVAGSTNVNGVISTSTTWTSSGGPYALSGNTLIDAGVTITVESGATVNLNGYYIRVNGSLIIQPGATLNMGTRDEYIGRIEVNGLLTARGTSTQPIYFNGAVYYWDSIMVPPSISSIMFENPSTAWNEQTGTGCIIENAVLNRTGVTMGASVKFSNNHLSGASISTGGTAIISNNILSNGASIAVSGGSPTITQNQIINGYVALDGPLESPVISGNVISNANPTWPYSTSACISILGESLYDSTSVVLIEHNVLKNSAEGLALVENENININKPITIRYNTIINNTIGIGITDKFSPTITNNNIYGNTNASITLSSFASRDINAANNWWGTTNTATIDQSIIDYYDDFNLGKVNYTPFLTSPDPNAPDPNIIIPTTTATNTPTPTPSVNPTEQTATPTPISPQAPENPFFGLNFTELAIFVALMVVIVLLITDIYFRRASKPAQPVGTYSVSFQIHNLGM